MTGRLIETWLPIAQLGVESLRERTPMTPFPAPNRLHVWWALAAASWHRHVDADRDLDSHKGGSPAQLAPIRVECAVLE